MPKCPYCKSEKFKIGLIQLENENADNGSAEVVYCGNPECEKIIFFTGNEIIRPYKEGENNGSSVGSAKIVR